MKFYSEKLDKLFDSQEELIAAESSVKTSKRRKSGVDNTPTTESVNQSPTRKELAAEVESADEAVKIAYANYETAKRKVEELSKTYLNELNSILEPAEKAVKEAEHKRYEAIQRFNDSYGAYQVTYTGARAADEMMKAISSINSKANKLFRDMFWI